MMDVDGLRLPLLWHAAPRPGDNDGSEVRASALGSSALAGRRVRLRLHFRDATIFALGAGSSDVAHATRSLKTEDRDAAPPLPLLRATEFGPTSLPATWGSAYLSNGVVGLRVGPNPLQQNSTQGMVGGGNALVHGWNWRIDANDAGQTPAPAVYPFETAVVIGGLSMAQHPEMVQVVEQQLDTATGELTTNIIFKSPTFDADLTVTAFLSRALPSVAALEVSVSVTPPGTAVDIRPALSLPNLPSKDAVDPAVVLQTLRNRSKAWPWQEGMNGLEDLLVLQHRGSRPVSSLGVATHVLRDLDGLRYRAAVGMITSAYDVDVENAAIRAALAANVRIGWDRVREQSVARWRELWAGRIVASGPQVTVEDQRVLDLAYFYMHSSVHASTKAGSPCYTLSQWSPLGGHIFWVRHSSL